MDIITDRYSLLLGDCLERLKSLESNSVDALVTDPPAGISFMGKDWDSNKGGSKEWINWLSDVLREVHRVLKPGAHGFIWALPRTSHWTAMAIEWADLEIRDCVTHLFGSGFPKSLNVLKAAGKGWGCELEIASASAVNRIFSQNGEVTETGGLGFVQEGAWEVASNEEKIEFVSIAASHSISLDLMLAEKTGGSRGVFVIGSASLPGSLPTYAAKLILIGPEEDSSEATGMSQYVVATVSIALSTMSLLKKKLGVGSGQMRTCITSTEIDRITGSRISSCLANQNTLKNMPCSGSALKPAAEFWWLIRKPLAEGGGIVDNVLKYGTGAINIGASRIGNEPRTSASASAIFGTAMKRGPSSECIGRFPANLVLSHSTDCVLRAEGKRVEGKRITQDFAGKTRERINSITYEDEPDQFDCIEDCPVRILDGQSGQFPGVVGAKQTGSFEFHAGVGGRSGKGMVGGKKDFGGASRFFYTAKPSTWERDAGLSDIPEGKARSAMVSCNGQGDQRLDGKPIATRRNVHPTVKPFSLMRYLITMITPPGGTVLDCFLGSGTTGAVAVACGFRFIGIEREPDYLEIARRRIADVRLQAAPTKE